MRPLRQAIALLSVALIGWAQQPGNNGNSNGLQISVVEGEDGANIVKDQTFAETIVEVHDTNNLPILAGATVTFLVVWDATHTGGGAPGAFANGSNSLTVTTDSSGRAAMTGFHPQGTGAMNVQVQASYQGRTGSLTIHQTNFPTVSAARNAGKNVGRQTSSNASNAAKASSAASGGGHALLITTLVIVGAGAAVGGAYAAGELGNKSTGGTSGGSGSSSSSCSGIASSVTSAQNSYSAAGCTTNLAASGNSTTCIQDYGFWAGYLISYCACNGGSPSPFSVSQFQSEAPVGQSAVVSEVVSACR